MPRIKRWFPVSHDINHSPTMRQLAREFGLPGWRVWMEILSIADRCGDAIDCTSKGAISRLTSAAETRNKVTIKVIQALLKAGCIETLDQHKDLTRVVKYWEFHRSEERKACPPDLPDLPDLPNSDNAPKRPPVDKSDTASQKPKGLDPKIREVAQKVYDIDNEKFKRLIVWIRQAEKNGFVAPVIVMSLERFLPHAREVEQWYPYLDAICYKAAKDFNRDAHQAEVTKLKEFVGKGRHA